ncbi:MAG TPA: glycosyltransferase [Limnochordia bacterium]|nr:glycosyltransferase [Limnochordia bacterium]
MEAHVLHVVRPADGGMLRHVRTLIHPCEPASRISVAGPDPARVAGGLDPAVQTFTLPIADGLAPHRDLRSAAALARLVRHSDVDLVHLHGLKAGLIGAWAMRWHGFGRPGRFCTRRPSVLLTLHNAMPPAAGRAARSRERAYGWALSAPDHIIAVSQALADQLIERRLCNRLSLSVIPNGIDLAPFAAPATGALRQALGLSPETALVGAISRLAAGKGIESLIGIAPSLATHPRNPHFVIIGDGPQRAHFEALAARVGADDRVHFLGWRDDVSALLPELDVFVLASESEGLPLSLLEAMASGRAVVASAVGGIPEAIQDGVTGLLIPPKAPAALAFAVERLLRDPEYALALGRCAKARARDFSLEEMRKKTSRLYRRLLEAT